jgi:formiminotetrahydrofolate cyclodeaminase
MKEECDYYYMYEKPSNQIVQELRNILADFRTTIEKDTIGFKNIGLAGEMPQRPSIIK